MIVYSGKVSPDIQDDIEGLSITQSIPNIIEATFKRKMNTNDHFDLEMSTVQEVFILTQHQRAKQINSKFDINQAYN